MSRKKLALLLGVCESTIEKVEKGTRKASTSLAEKWAALLGIQDVWLAFYANSPDYLSCEQSDTLAKSA